MWYSAIEGAHLPDQVQQLIFIMHIPWAPMNLDYKSKSNI